MSLLFETIRIVNGQIQNIDYHNSRLNKSRCAVFKVHDKIRLEQYLDIPSEYTSGLVKCKVIYGLTILDVTYSKYSPRVINSIQLVTVNQINYKYKFLDRENLEQLFLRRGNCDEIMIVKNGLITDTSFSNVIFSDGTKWLTPANPLLPGTMRSNLLAKKLIAEQKITLDDIWKFQSIQLINSMLPIESGTSIPIGNVRNLPPEE